MGLFSFLVSVFFKSLVLASEFDFLVGNASVHLSAQAYCRQSNLFNADYINPIEHFVPILALDFSAGFIGYDKSMSTILVFRGSHSVIDWTIDFAFKLVPYDKCSGCKVHDGFYRDKERIINSVLAVVSNLKSWFPDYKVVVTGHSLGGALATLTAVDLVNAGYLNTTMINFGSPKVGNAQFAAYASSLLLPTLYRVTHYRDLAPHYPTLRTYSHTSGEWYEDNMGQIHACIGPADKACSAKWSLFQTNFRDHLIYLGRYMRCDLLNVRNTTLSVVTGEEKIADLQSIGVSTYLDAEDEDHYEMESAPVYERDRGGLVMGKKSPAEERSTITPAGVTADPIAAKESTANRSSAFDVTLSSVTGYLLTVASVLFLLTSAYVCITKHWCSSGRRGCSGRSADSGEHELILTKSQESPVRYDGTVVSTAGDTSQCSTISTSASVAQATARSVDCNNETTWLDTAKFDLESVGSRGEINL